MQERQLPIFETLHEMALEVAEQSLVPYSKKPVAAILLRTNGDWLPGVRVESASFSLVIPAVLNAFTSAVSLGISDIQAVVSSRQLLPEEITYLRSTPFGAFDLSSGDVAVRQEHNIPIVLGECESPFLSIPTEGKDHTEIELARMVAQRAFVPESSFPVGCVIKTDGGHYLPGVNVEHPDWSRILCAERNALGSAISWGISGLKEIHLTCIEDSEGTPCGACRQLLSELIPQATVWMDRGSSPPEQSSPLDLLPGAFNGQKLPGLE